LSTNINILLYYFSEGKWTLPLWHEEVCWELLLEQDSEFVEKKSDTINENPSSAEKDVYIVLYVKEYWLVMKRRRPLAK
jgi:hypothetical protein